MHWLLPEPTRIESPAQPCSDFPTALLFGQSVYTSFRWPLADQWRLAHYRRLADNARSLGMDWRYSNNDLDAHIAACALAELPIVRLSAFPMVAAYGDFFNPTPHPAQLLLSFRNAPAPSKERLRLRTVRHDRSMPQLKLGAMAEEIQLKRQALADGFDDVLFVNRDGRLSEASTANLFLIADDGLYTPDPVRDGCLPGITRVRILEIANALGIACVESLPDRPVIDGAFLTNAVQGIQPIGAIDTHRLPWTDQAQVILREIQAKL